MLYNIKYSCVSHKGRVRRLNQDNFFCQGRYLLPERTDTSVALNGEFSSKDNQVLAVFDGMGGEECGEIAAYIAAKDVSGLNIGANPASELSMFCYKANDDICNYADLNGISAMGTTAAILGFTKKGVSLCNIGDSKIFRFSNSRLEQISTDHISVAAFGIKPPLSQNLGIPSTEMIIEPYLANGKYHDGDIYLICSDGLTDMVSPAEISGVLGASDCENAASALLDLALSNGGRDNITIITVYVQCSTNVIFDSLMNFLDKKRR